jgi:AraC family transcriptional regulator
MVEELADALGGRAAALEPGKLKASSRVAALGKLVREEMAARESGYLLSVDALSEAMTVSMLRGAGERASGPTARDPRVRAVLDLVHSSYAEPIGIDDLARAAGTSRFHMSRLFRESVGQSPYQYLVRVRIERAAELLRGGKRSVTEVAFSVGFGDLGRFARTFRQLLGVTPGSFARGERGR